MCLFWHNHSLITYLFLYLISRRAADDDCRGDLVCFERGDGDKGPVPGCTEKDGRGTSGWDYWYVCLNFIGDDVCLLPEWKTN